MAKESITWYSEEWNTEFEGIIKVTENHIRNELDAGEWDNKTLGSVFVRYFTDMLATMLGEELFNLTFEEIDKYTDEQMKELRNKLDAVFGDETKVKEFFPKG